jgi:hypothetical protein
MTLTITASVALFVLVFIVPKIIKAHDAIANAPFEREPRAKPADSSGSTGPEPSRSKGAGA